MNNKSSKNAIKICTEIGKYIRIGQGYIVILSPKTRLIARAQRNMFSKSL